MKNFGNKYCTIDKFGIVARGASKHRPRNDPKLYGGQYPFIQTAEISNSNLYISNYNQTYNELGLAQSKLWEPGTLCIVNAGVNTGDNAILTFKACFPDSIIGFRPYTDKCCVKYLKYFFDSIKDSIRSITMGATQDNLSVSKLLTFKIPKLPLPIQRKIAAVLSAYDDLIENNNRRIAILEKMAEELYREWFIRLRFPGHEKVKVVKGVPEGWEMRPFIELVIKNPNLKVEKGIEKTYVGMEALSTTSMIFNSDQKRIDISGSKFQNYDVLFPRITPCLENGKRGFVMTLDKAEVGIGSTEFIVFREKILPSEIIYFICCQEEFRKNAENSMVGASGRQRVHEDCFKSFIIKTPPDELLKRFSSVIKPMFSQIRDLHLKQCKLKLSRDRLLSRLLGGKIDVESLDIRFPASMQGDDLTTECTENM